MLYCFVPVYHWGLDGLQLHSLHKHSGGTSLWWGVMMCDVVVLVRQWLWGVAHYFESSISTLSVALWYHSCLFRPRERSPALFGTCVFFSAYHLDMHGPAWWCQHTVWHRIHSELWHSPVDRLLYVPLRSAVFLFPLSIHLSAFIYSVLL